MCAQSSLYAICVGQIRIASVSVSLSISFHRCSILNNVSSGADILTVSSPVPYRQSDLTATVEKELTGRAVVKVTNFLRRNHLKRTMRGSVVRSRVQFSAQAGCFAITSPCRQMRGLVRYNEVCYYCFKIIGII